MSGDPPEIVGREEELERITVFAQRTNAPALLLIEGSAGIGKTTLWGEGVRMLEGAGFRVLQSTPAASEARVSLSTLADLIEPAYGLVRAELPAPQRRALDVVLALDDPPEGVEESERLLYAATLGAFRALAEPQPLAIAIDDSQWIDPESGAALTYALRRIRTERLLCLFSLRPKTGSALDAGQLGELLVERLNVGPLSLGATQRLLLQKLGVTYPRSVIRRLVETSGGNPFYALELARGLERTGDAGAGEPPVLSETLGALIAARLEGVSDDARRLLGILSLVSEASLQLLDSLDVLAPLDEVVAARLVRVHAGTATFDHPLLAAGARARLGPEERRGLHAALAQVLDDPVERARHLAQSTITESAETAAHLADAAALASSRGMSPLAADLAADAVRVTPASDEGPLRERRLLEAKCRVQGGAFERAAEVLDEVLPELPPGDERAVALRLRARVVGSDVARQRELLLESLAVTDDPALSAEANALLVRNYLYSGELDEALDAARLAEEQARRTGDFVRIAAATTTRGLMEIWGTGTADSGVLEHARELARADVGLPADTYSNPHTLLGARALYRYELDAARSSYTVAAAAAEVAGEVDSLETFWWGLAQLEVRAGRYALAHEYVEKIREGAESEGRRPLSVRWIEGVLATYDGRVEEARDALGETLTRAEEGENWFFVAYTRSALGLLELSLDLPRAAVEVVEPVLEDAFVVRGDPGQTGVLPLAAEAFVQSGALDRAAAIVELLEDRGRELEHVWCLASAARCRGLLLAEQGEHEQAVGAFDEALVHHDRAPAPFERARTVLARGSVQRRARQRRAARESLEAALASFEELATPLWVAKARLELGRVGGRAPSRGELTPNEARIASLVAEGRTNKEVAAELYVTDRTVESALTQIYRKLDVRSRTELARKLAGRP